MVITLVAILAVFIAVVGIATVIGGAEGAAAVAHGGWVVVEHIAYYLFIAVQWVWTRYWRYVVGFIAGFLASAWLFGHLPPYP